MLNWSQRRDHPLEADALSRLGYDAAQGRRDQQNDERRLAHPGGLWHVAAAQAMRRGEFTDEFVAAV